MPGFRRNLGAVNPAGRFLPILLAAALCVAGCGSSKAAPETRQKSAGIAKSPEPFQAMRIDLEKLKRLRAANDAAGARSAFPEILGHGKRLLVMPPPNDLNRENIPRFLEARATFSDELNALGRATESTDDAALWRSTEQLDSAFWGWYDGYRGRPSEGAV